MDKESPAKEPATEAESIGKELPSIDQVEGTEVKGGDESQPRRGRPPKDIETVKRVPFSVSLSPKLVSRIIDQAEEEDVSRSELINEAIGFYLDMHKPGKEYVFLDEDSFRKVLGEEIFDKYNLAPKDAVKTKPETEKEHSEKDEDEEDGVGILGIHF